MVPVKDHATFVEAAAALTARRSDVQLVFVGGGEMEPEVRAQVARLGLAERSHFVGWQRDLARIYADLDVVALSSINEGTPVTLIEGMASGVPVAATAVGGVPDVLDGGRLGELAPPSNPTALADAIDRALQPGSRKRASLNRSEVLDRYGGARLCKDLEVLYGRLLGSR
jgi:glycosyltransferase involved in cell wall biosynthesis